MARQKTIELSPKEITILKVIMGSSTQEKTPCHQNPKVKKVSRKISLPVRTAKPRTTTSSTTHHSKTKAATLSPVPAATGKALWTVSPPPSFTFTGEATLSPTLQSTLHTSSFSLTFFEPSNYPELSKSTTSVRPPCLCASVVNPSSSSAPSAISAPVI